MIGGLVESIVYNLYEPECRERFTDEEIREAIETYLTKRIEKMNRTSLNNIVRYYREENSRLREENSRLQRQIDILMGHDVR